MLRIDAAWGAPLVVLAALVVVTLWLYLPTVLGMVSLWNASDTYAHGFVVPAIVAWLIWRQRARLARLTPKPSWLAVALALLVALSWAAGDLVAVNAVTQLALVALLVLWVVAVLGWEVARTLAFPLGFLYFTVPIGDFLLPSLMEWTADFTVLALRASGLPVYREGLQFVIPSGTWSVVEACSGIRYLIASVTVGCLFAHLSFVGWRKQLLFVAFSVAVPLVANWMRAYLIVMIGHLSGNELATGVDHLIYGWVFFGVVILGMLMVGARYADTPGMPLAGSADPNGSAPGLRSHNRAASLVALSCLLVAALPHAMRGWWAASVSSEPVRWTEPAPRMPWRSSVEQPVAWSPAFQHAVETVTSGYVAPGKGWVGLHVSYYRQQGYERKLVTSSNALVATGDPRWSQVARGEDDVLVDGRSWSVDTAELRGAATAALHGGQRLLAWRFYWVDGHFTHGDVEAKLRGAWGLAAGRGDDGAIVVLYTPLDAGVGETQARASAALRLRGFLSTQGSALQQALQSTREGS
jgi:exosortase A